MYVEIKDNKLLSWCANPYSDYEFIDIDYETFDPEKYKVIDGTLKDISETPEYINKQLENAKKNKIEENSYKRDEYLLSGVTYKDIVFDSDTDQKINLMFASSSMNEEDIIFWLGKDNVPLQCNKQDLKNIGNLISELTSYVWSEKNPSYIQQINESPDLETLNSITIEY